MKNMFIKEKILSAMKYFKHMNTRISDWTLQQRVGSEPWIDTVSVTGVVDKDMFCFHTL